MNTNSHGWKQRFEDQLKIAEDAQRRLTEAEAVIDALRTSQSEGLSSPTERPLGTRERQNLQLMLIVCAMRAYGFQPCTRNSAATKIEHDLDALDLRITAQTIREHLQAQQELIPQNWRSRLRLKVNSPDANMSSPSD